MNKFVYVALIEMHTWAGSIIKFLTGIPYSHITISFDENLESCHAIQTLNEHTPLIANYVNENPSYYVINNNKQKKVRIAKYKIPVTEEEKKNIEEFINEYRNDTEYLYNMFSAGTSLVLGGFRIHKTMICGEFVAKILTFISSVKFPKPYYKMFPKDFYKYLNEYKIYEGELDTSTIERDDHDIHFAKIKTWNYLKKSMYIVRELIYRLIFKKVSKNFDYRKARITEEDKK